ncbi:ribulose-5-phosphate 4-epimerase/fuculose-1-phosphate aldolase [Rhizobium aquaticum]|uniref:Ribulose-5-phosphate 4-epimerase/fuculose-1-phosphate aldolase n=1 Tax=Rhizobium aquaticum TaxID=1549636 RepID=A0ABV2J4G9_9HYPH
MSLDRTTIEETLGLAAARLAGKGLLKPGDTLSQRIPEQNAMVLTGIVAGQDVPEDFAWSDLMGSSSDLHHAIYAARPDVGAIATGQFTWTSMLSRLDLSLPPIFDEQIRQLGVEARRVARRSTEPGAFPALHNGANGYCLDNLSICLGMGLERLLLNIEILEKSAESFVLAASAGLKVKRIPWLIKYIANGRLRKDQKDAAARHLRGERSIMKAGY